MILLQMLLCCTLYVGIVLRSFKQTSAATAKIQAAQILAEAARRRAEAASQIKSDFLATISHEIRTPLNAVTSAAHLLNGTPLSQSQAEYVSILKNGSEVLLSLINDVLDMSKIEAGKIVLEIDDLDLGAFVEKLRSLWSPKAAETGLTLDIGMEPDLPAFVRVDNLRLTQIMFNLVSNAIKFTSTGRVQVRIRRLEGDGEGVSNRLIFDVTDTGPGMTSDVISRLFNRFEQADAGITRRFGGTGLGLAISRRLAEVMSGYLTVESTVGQGSTFRLDIPLIPGAVERCTSPDSDSDSDSVEPEMDARAPLSVLVAEDHPVNRRIVALLLEPLGWSLVQVENGAEAVDAAGREPFDAILMDMQMPVMSGLEATRLIRGGTGPNTATPIIALTANALEEHRSQWLDVGADGFLAKPIDPAALVATILTLTDPGAAQQSLAKLSA
jgi:signal transduction histidine kinase/ActR/RegA family two-component response regulator